MKRIITALGLLVACAPATRISRQETRYPDGQPHEEFATRDGVRHGKSRTWHANRTLESEGNYVLGKREGRFVYYDDRGTFERQVLFIGDEEVWSSTDPSAMPDRSKLTSDRTKRSDAALAPTPAMLPVPWFSSIDRTTALDRAGVQLGFGGPAALSFGSVRRLEVFGNYSSGTFGGYGQFSQTSLETMSGVVFDGRRTLEAGGTIHVPLLPLGTTVGRLGVAIPIGNDDGNGFVASTAGSFQRPVDAATSIPSAVAVRTSANWTHVIKRFVFQGDAGVDWLLGGEPRAFDALARANVGLGFGSRSRLLSVELTNTVPVVAVDRWLLGVDLAGAWRIEGFWISAALSYSVFGDTAFTTAVGYEL